MEEKEVKKVIGLMSGTSCDSIDAGLCEVYPDMSVKLIQGINHPYPEHIRAKIFSAFRGDISVKELCQLNFAVGKCFADAANMPYGDKTPEEIMELAASEGFELNEAQMEAVSGGCDCPDHCNNLYNKPKQTVYSGNRPS